MVYYIDYIENVQVVIGKRLPLLRKLFKAGRVGSIPALNDIRGKMNSRAFKNFKKKMGQANHFLITILIGLDAVKNGAQKDENFDAAWNPYDVQASVRRSKEFAINSALAWAVDGLDMYVRLCNREPKLFHSQESINIDKTKHSIYNKIRIITENHKELDPIKSAFVDLLICWRNNMLHFDADNALLQSSNTMFKKESTAIAVEKYHLNIGEMLEHFHANATPTFKEIATMFSMTIHFVEELDGLLMNDIDKTTYCEIILKKFLKENPDARHWKVFQKNSNIPYDERIKMIKQFFITLGVCPELLEDNMDAIYNIILRQNI